MVNGDPMVQSKRGSVATLQPPNGYLAQQELNGHRGDRDHRRNLKNEDNLYFIVDDKGNGALSPEMALPQSAQNGLRPINGMEAMNGMNGGSRVRTDRRRENPRHQRVHSPRHQRMQSPRNAEQDLNDWMSRTEILEDENVRLKSDVRKLKKAVRELNNTVQQIMQTLQQQ